MTPNQPLAQMDYIGVLKAAVKNWPLTESEKRYPQDSAIAEFISPDFDPIEFASDVDDVSSILSIDGSDEHKVVVFDDVNGFRYRAIVDYNLKSGWRLRSVKFQCPVCFGDGVNEGGACTMCGGSGWGVSR